jgi:SPRY domain
VYLGAYAIDDELDIFLLVIASIVDRESFKKKRLQLDSATGDYLATRLDYYQVNIDTSLKFRANFCLAVRDNYCSIKVTNGKNDNSWHGFIWDANIHKYTVAVDASNDMLIMIGFAPSKLFDVSTGNYDSCGWYLYLRNGSLYSQNGDNCKAYSSGCKAGDTITCIYNALSGEISFEKNGVSLGVAFPNVNGEDIAPAVALYNVGDSTTLTTE